MGQAHKATCPDCRTAIAEEPHPSYVIRELVLVFMGRTELLAEGESVEKHQEYAREEAEAVVADRANQDPSYGGLFKGVFRRRNARLIAIRDHEDNVWRCPDCHHEIEDQYCPACTRRVYYDSDEDSDDFSYGGSDDISEELDEDLELDDDVSLAGGEDGFPFADIEAEEDDDIDVDAYLRDRDLMHAMGRDAEGESISSDDSDDEGEEHDEEDEEQDPEMDSFIVNDDEVEYEGEPTSEDVHTPSIITVVDDPDEEDDDDSPVITQQRRARPTRTILLDSDDDEGEDDDVQETLPPMRVAFRRPAERQFLMVDSDDEEEEEEEDVEDDGNGESDEDTENGIFTGHDLDGDEDDDEDDDGDSSQNGVPSSSAAGEGFSPLQHDMRTGYDYYEDDNDDDDDDDGHGHGWDEGAARWGAHRPAP
jgi:hypothetical protein